MREDTTLRRRGANEIQELEGIVEVCNNCGGKG